MQKNQKLFNLDRTIIPDRDHHQHHYCLRKKSSPEYTAGKSAGINSATVSKKKKAMENQPPKGDSRNFNTVFIKTTTLAQKLRNNKINKKIFMFAT